MGVGLEKQRNGSSSSGVSDSEVNDEMAVGQRQSGVLVKSCVTSKVVGFGFGVFSVFFYVCLSSD